MNLTSTALVIAVMSAWAGCVTESPRTRTCAVILLMDGQHLIPSKMQFAAVQRSMGRQFELRSLSLVPDVAAADLIATIECRKAPDDPSRTDLIVRDVGANTFTAKPAKVSHPTLERIEREQLEAVRGYSRQIVD